LLLLAYTGLSLGLPALPLIVLGSLAKEFILGFPELVLSPGSRPDRKAVSEVEVHEMVGWKATTTAALRLQGEVSIDGENFRATSDSATMIDAGVLVEVVGFRNGNLLVSVLNG
jgi:membrane-bound ClpP family serine protease